MFVTRRRILFFFFFTDFSRVFPAYIVEGIGRHALFFKADFHRVLEELIDYREERDGDYHADNAEKPAENEYRYHNPE